MTVRLNKTDVAVIGLGGVGGVAVLPLAQAGLEVVGLEAGAWLSPRDFAPDELRNEALGWPQSVQKANHEVPVHRASESSPDSPRLPPSRFPNRKLCQKNALAFLVVTSRFQS